MDDPAPTTVAAILGALLGGGGIAALIRAVRRPHKGDAELRREVADLRERVARLERERENASPRTPAPSSPGFARIPEPSRPDHAIDQETPRGILIIEDDRSYARAEQRLLAELGEPIDLAHTAEDVRAMLADRVYAVAVVDLGVPGISAREIVRDLLDRRTRVVLCSGRDAEEIERERIAIGADRGVAKTDGGDAIIAAVQALLPRKES
jgi:CheY-like chemotaxis protein